jgi:23S rRNA (adenine2503-C2)-methyltransferase
VIALQGETPRSLRERIPDLDEAEARRVIAAVHREQPIGAPIRGVRRAALDAVRLAGHVPTLARVALQKSSLDPFHKLALAGDDGRPFETVRIPLDPRRGRAGPGEESVRFSVCVSSQVGCALACAFCATGRLGLLRNLETWEIVEQVREVRRGLSPERGERVHGVVFQGMGEPLANLDRVLGAIAVLTNPCARPVDARAMTVCTSGIPSGILRLAREAPRVRLGISIASALPGDRRSLMPIDAAHPLDDVLDAAAAHVEASGYAPMWAVTLLAGRNDSLDHARALAALAQRFAARTGVRPRISVIPYNAIGEGDPFARSEAHGRFRDELARAGVYSHERYSGGADIAAACGQLRAAAT